MLHAFFNAYVGHGGWVTAMQVGVKKEGETENEFLITGSRGISISVLTSLRRQVAHHLEHRAQGTAR